MKRLSQITVVIVIVYIVAAILILSKKRSSINPFMTATSSHNNSAIQEKSKEKLIPGSCTIFGISYNGSVFMGNNEDWKNPLTFFWVKPAKEGEYGILYFGYDDFGPQGGINEKGLAFDGNALPYIKINSHPDRLQPSEAIVNNIIMQKCATVEEAIKMANSYDWGKIYSGKFAGQYLLADATGDAAVIGFGSDGELAVTRKPSGNGYIVSTNFNRANPENRYGAYPCRRFKIASKMLESINKEEDLTLNFLASVLDAVHEDGRTIKTLYSNIFDLKNGIVYLYFMHDYKNVCKLNAYEIISSNQPPKRIKDIFPQNIPEKGSDGDQNYSLKVGLIIGWIILVIGSLIIAFSKIFRYNGISRKKRVLWILIILFMGPIGLIFLFIAKNCNQVNK